MRAGGPAGFCLDVARHTRFVGVQEPRHDLLDDVHPLRAPRRPPSQRQDTLREGVKKESSKEVLGAKGLVTLHLRSSHPQARPARPPPRTKPGAADKAGRRMRFGRGRTFCGARRPMNAISGASGRSLSPSWNCSALRRAGSVRRQPRRRASEMTAQHSTAQHSTLQHSPVQHTFCRESC